jgi:hypothetical protein
VRLTALYLTSITCGFCMMALEILGARFIQPVFGSSIDVWAAIISVFILSLSIGYVVGGRIADRSHTNEPLGWVILLAGVCFCVIPVVGLPLMQGLGEGVHTARWGVLLAATVLFLFPSLLLGTVSPMLVKLVFVDASRVGRTTGFLYAIGSVGNVLGILVSDYVLLAYVPINTSILVMGGVLCLLGVIHVGVRAHATGHVADRVIPEPA